MTDFHNFILISPHLLLTSSGRNEYRAPMARKPYRQYPGAIHYLVNRGDRGEPSFADDSERRRFPGALTQDCRRTGSPAQNPDPGGQFTTTGWWRRMSAFRFP